MSALLLDQTTYPWYPQFDTHLRKKPPEMALATSVDRQAPAGLRNHIDHTNVTDSHEVMVLASAAPNMFALDPRFENSEDLKQKEDQTR